MVFEYLLKGNRMLQAVKFASDLAAGSIDW